MEDGRRALLSARVNPLAPGIVAAAGLVTFAAGSRFVGAGLAAGALLGAFNAASLSRRVDVAAASGDVARAMLIMQLGMVLTFSVIAIVTIVLIHISLTMTVAAAAGFAITHLAVLALFYAFRGRREAALERNAP